MEQSSVGTSLSTIYYTVTIYTIYCDYLYYLLSPMHHSSVPMSTLSTPPPAAALNTT